MSDTAQAMLRKMREVRQKGPEGGKGATINPEDFYVRLVITPYRRRQLYFYGICLFAIFWILVRKNMALELPWQALIIPVSILGFATLLLPPSESWEYRPWQTQARRYEQHQADRGQAK